MKTPWNESTTMPHDTLVRSVMALTPPSLHDAPAVSHARPTTARGLGKRLFVKLRLAIEAAQTRKILSRLDDHLLQDIGLSRHEIPTLRFAEPIAGGGRSRPVKVSENTPCLQCEAA